MSTSAMAEAPCDFDSKDQTIYEGKIESVKLIKKNVEFVIKPHVRFKDEAGEQATMFFKDPSGNDLEFKAFHSDDLIFAKSL